MTKPSRRSRIGYLVLIVILCDGCRIAPNPALVENTPTAIEKERESTPRAFETTPLATTAPTPLPSPTKTVTGRTIAPPTAIPETLSGVRAYESTVSFKVYPYEKARVSRQDPVNHFTFSAFDKKAYEAALITQPLVTKTVRSLIMENEYLQLTFLPELGGRLFQIFFKPTRQNLFYNNRVLKPTDWGPANQGGWMAIGGMEWALPVNEHGYEWGIPWESSITRDKNGATLTFIDTQASDRIRARIQVTLPAHAAYIIVHPRIENPTKVATPIQFWINAQITLGASKNVSPKTEFILPTKSAFVHSTGNQFIPQNQIPRGNAQAPAQPVSWPVFSDRDMSWYSSWEDYLGLFVSNPIASFAGAYNHDTELGLVRVFLPERVPGAKLFAFGPKFCCRGQFSDDDSDYFELWGGLPSTFFSQDDIILAAGETREWSEYWAPFTLTGGLSYASRDLVLFVKNDNGKVSIGAFSTTVTNGMLVLLSGEKEIQRWQIAVSPAMPFSKVIQINPGKVKLQFSNSKGVIVAEASDPANMR